MVAGFGQGFGGDSEDGFGLGLGEKREEEEQEQDHGGQWMRNDEDCWKKRDRLKAWALNSVKDKAYSIVLGRIF